MNSSVDVVVLKQFRTIPGVGKSIAVDLWDLGFRSLEAIAASDPEEMYVQLCSLRGIRIDPCMLYTFRCAVYFATTELPDPELLKWWNWKDRRLAMERST